MQWWASVSSLYLVSFLCSEVSKLPSLDQNRIRRTNCYVYLIVKVVLDVVIAYFEVNGYWPICVYLSNHLLDSFFSWHAPSEMCSFSLRKDILFAFVITTGLTLEQKVLFTIFAFFSGILTLSYLCWNKQTFNIQRVYRFSVWMYRMSHWSFGLSCWDWRWGYRLVFFYLIKAIFNESLINVAM